MSKQATKQNPGKPANRMTFYDRVRLLADTTLRHSKDTREREEAIDVLKLMEAKKAA